ncbi:MULTISPECIES: hypothetical protein [unclassified Leptospira]|uniref:hypothetical protein n=1 Tax=unclassified Leptospira TaxID=2633828 RepID=UPI0012EA8119|nr:MULTISPECIES: hypothetical protein [unclassified Leptospira]
MSKNGVSQMKYNLRFFISLTICLLSTEQLLSDENGRTYKDVSDYPYYLGFKVTDDLQLTTRLETTQKGNYQIVLGTVAHHLPAKLGSMISIKLNGKYHKDIKYKSIIKEGKIFLSINFSIEDDDAYRNRYGDAYPNRYVYCFISILTDELRKLSSEDKNLLRSAILEFGFRKL